MAVIGLGNTLLRDDGVGVYAVRRFAEALPSLGQPWADEVEVTEAGAAGFEMLDLCAGRRKVIIVDAILPENVSPEMGAGGSRAIGDIIAINPGSLARTARLSAVHGVNLGTALEFGRRAGLPMPDEVHIIAVVVEDVTNFGEGCTPPVADAIPRVVETIARLVGQNPHTTALPPV